MTLTTDTVVVFAEITNYALLQEVIFSPCDQRIFDCAVVRALYLVGPNRFFRDLQKRYSGQPELLSQQRHQKLKTLTTERHAAVDAVFVDDKDMKPAEEDAVFSQIANELRRGAAFATVQQRYYEAHHYSYTETLSDGTKVDLTRTRVGNFGDFVISTSVGMPGPFETSNCPQNTHGVYLQLERVTSSYCAMSPNTGAYFTKSERYTLRRDWQNGANQ